MQERVYILANVFWAVVAKARHTTPKAIASLEAGVFVGQAAVAVGVADGVLDWEPFIRTLTRALDMQENSGAVAPAA
jgi:ClpP class serine protease